MPRQLFRSRLQAIRAAGYDIQPLGWAVGKASAGLLERPTVAITFDDGWQDFYSEAWPILREFNCPATVYQTTFYSNYSRPVFDTAVPYLLWSARGSELRDSPLTGSDSAFPLHSAEEIRRASLAVKNRARLLGVGAEEKDSMLRRLSSALSLDLSSFLHSRMLQLMNNAEVAEISRAGIDVQLHTHTHRLPRERQHFLRELERNRSAIEAATGRPASHFCYPNGWHRPELGEWLKAAGVETATTCDPGLVNNSSQLFYLPRLTDSCCVSPVRFESWLAGIGLVGSWCKRWLTDGASSPSRSKEAVASMEDVWLDEPDPEEAPLRGEWAARAAGGR